MTSIKTKFILLMWDNKLIIILFMNFKGSFITDELCIRLFERKIKIKICVFAKELNVLWLTWIIRQHTTIKWRVSIHFVIDRINKQILIFKYSNSWCTIVIPFKGCTISFWRKTCVICKEHYNPCFFFEILKEFFNW